MKYKDMDCGIRVVTAQGAGVVESYDAEVPELRALFDGLATKPKHPKATVLLDTGFRATTSISGLKREKA